LYNKISECASKLIDKAMRTLLLLLSLRFWVITNIKDSGTLTLGVTFSYFDQILSINIIF